MESHSIKKEHYLEEKKHDSKKFLLLIGHIDAKDLVFWSNHHGIYSITYEFINVSFKRTPI